MLTLFMMLGAAYLVVATRSRETARAYAKLSLRNDNVRLPHSQIFDTVMLRVLRGVPAGQSVNVTLAEPKPPGVEIATTFESLLADKYGGDRDVNGNYTVVLTGTAVGINTTPVYERAPVLVLPSVTLDTLPIPAPNNGPPFAGTDLAGRVITILGTGRDPSSHRILRANGKGRGPYEIIVDNQPRNRAYEPVNAESCRIVINGREFSGSDPASQPNESWDGFDDANPFLAWVAPRDLQNQPLDKAGPFIGTGSQALPVSVSSSVVQKVGFVKSSSDLTQLNKSTNGFSYGADNDNDGVNDGFFLDFGLPTVISPNGDQVTLHASVLILDLDGRVNVNAHGSLVPVIYPLVPDKSKNFNYPQISGTSVHKNWNLSNLPVGSPTLSDFAMLPIGSGYGPAEINLDLLFPPENSPSTSKTYGFPRRQPGEFPLLYLRTGVSALRMSGANGGISPQGSRFYNQAGSKTPQINSSEGRYGNFVVSQWAPPVGPTSLLADGPNFRYYPVPGKPSIDDAASAINDHRSPIGTAKTTTASPRTIGYDGVPPLWWNADDGKIFNWADKTTPFTGSPSLYPRATYNSPPDLHGRMKTFTTGAAPSTGIVPQLCFVKPEWSRNGNLDVETRDDPYEIRLDTRAPRNSWLFNYSANFNPNGNIFNLSELENILRPYDIDSSKLPPRLEAILGSVAEEARLRITTDSWDSTAVSGKAAARLFNWARKLSQTLGDDGSKLYGATNARNKPVLDGVINREIARGERFDLNRPLTGTKPVKYDINDAYYAQRQAYFKDLYILMCALCEGGDGGFAPDQCAQWAANVVEFRDADSVMTPFEYDPTPSDGWDVDNDASGIASTEATSATQNSPAAQRIADTAKRRIVFGTERPEILITETSAWEDDKTGELFVMLHRPWNAKAFAKLSSASDTSITAEACDPLLDCYDVATNPALNPLDRIDLGRKSGGDPTKTPPWPSNTNTKDSTSYPIWRLRIADIDGNTLGFIRFDTSSGSGTTFASSTLTDATTPWIGVDGWACIMGSNSLPIGSKVTFSPSPPPNTASPPTKTDTAPQATSQVNCWTFDGLRVPGSAPPANADNRPAIVYLERLTDPTARPTDAQWNLNPAKKPSELTPDELSGMAIYRIVDEARVDIVNRTPTDPVTRVVPPEKDPVVRRRRTSDLSTAFWNNSLFDTIRVMQMGVFTPTEKPSWFNWPNRPFAGSAELHLIHSLDSESLLRTYTKPTLDPDSTVSQWTSALLKTLKNPPLFDAVHVPTRFAGIHGTTADPNGNLAKLAGIDQVTTPVNQLSSFREPGRVNLNTVTAEDVWNAVVAGPLVRTSNSAPYPVVARSDAGLTTSPAQTFTGLIGLKSGDATATSVVPPVSDKQDADSVFVDAMRLNPAHGIYTATRLSNTATTRSHLFGVWITLREAMAPAPAAGLPAVPADPDGVRYHRAFYVIDRSIPVAHEPGRDHNVWDAVLLRRIVE
jgi:hypothetical protein